jgi:hypothetical protein
VLTPSASARLSETNHVKYAHAASGVCQIVCARISHHAARAGVTLICMKPPSPAPSSVPLAIVLLYDSVVAAPPRRSCISPVGAGWPDGRSARLTGLT